MLVWLWGLVPELPRAREDHRQSMLVGGCDHLGVLYGTARLNDSDDPGRRSFVHPVRKRKEGIARHHGPLGIVPLLPRLVDRQEGAVHAAHLPGPDADCPSSRAMRIAFE